MLLEAIVGTIIIVLIENVLAKRYTPRIRKDLKKVYSDWGGIDRAFRFVQLISTVIVRYWQSSAMFAFDYSGLIMIANAHKLGMFINIIGKVRKGIRFFRGRLVCIRLKTTIPSIDFSTERERIFSAENILIYLSDICDIGFYFTDHYSVFYEVGIIQSKTHLELFDLLGIYFWIWCCSFLIGALLFRLYRIYKMEKNREAWEVKKKTAYMDIIRYSLDILLAFSYIDSNFITKDNVLIFSFCSNILGLLKFDVI